MRNGEREENNFYPQTSDNSDIQDATEEGLEETKSANLPTQTIQVPAEISSTLEHMVKQMEILTDVSYIDA